MPVVGVVVLFTDLVGSTEQSSRQSLAESESLRHTHFELLRAALAAHDGTEVKNLGDGLMVVFTVPSAALACAVAMQQAIDRHNRSAPEPLAVRIGISGGEATLEDGDYFGDPVVEAARLCAHAVGGQVLVSDVVRSMAGRRSPHTFLSVGDLELKGLPDALPTVELAWEPLAGPGDGVPLPTRLQVAPAMGFFGRVTELAALAVALKTTAAGDGRRVLLLQGEPGMGKTTLCGEFTRAAHAEGVVVLYGRCEDELEIPYQPFAEALAHYVSHATTDDLTEHVARHGSDLVALVPAVADRVGELPPSAGADAEGQRHLLFAAVAGLLASLSARRPVVFVLDDLHWADKATLLLLRYLVGTESLTRVMVVGSYRGSELDANRPLSDALATLRREPGVERLELAGLEDSEVFALMESGAGHALGDELTGLAHQLRRETSGNPFFLLELMRHLVETGWLFEEDGRWQARAQLSEIGMPESLREVVGQRVRRLGEEAATLLTSAAVVGRDFDVTLVAALAGMDEDAAIDHCERAVTARLLTGVAPGRYSFAHAVVQYTLYDGLSPTRRARAHHRVAEMLERMYGEGPGPRVGEVARHWMAATHPADLAKAITYARWAGEAALAALAPEEAVRWYGQALELGPDEASRTELLIGLGNAQRLTGDPGHRETFLEAARLAQQRGDISRLVRAALDNTRGIMGAAGAVDPEYIAVLEAALAATSGDSPERARLLATLAVQLTFSDERDRRWELADQALDMAGRVDDPATYARVVNMLWFCIAEPSTVQRRLHLTAEAVARAAEQSDPAVRHLAHRLHLYSCQETGDLDGIDADLPKVIEYAAAAGDPACMWGATFIRSWRALLAGELEASEALAHEALSWGQRSSSPEAEALFVLQLLEIRRPQGRFDGMDVMLADAESWGIAAFRGLLALVHCELGQLDQAQRLLDAAAASGLAALPTDFTGLYDVASYAEACTRLGDRDVASVLVDLLGPWHDQVPSLTCATCGSVAYCLGLLTTLLGRYDTAEAHFAEALAIHQRMQAPFWIGRVQVEHACMLLARNGSGNAERAVAMLDDAQAVAGQYGFAALSRQVAEVRG